MSIQKCWMHGCNKSFTRKVEDENNAYTYISHLLQPLMEIIVIIQETAEIGKTSAKTSGTRAESSKSKRKC